MEEAAEIEDEASPFVQHQQQQPPFKKHQSVISKPVVAVAAAAAAARPLVQTQDGREMVAHPIAGVQVSVPQSRLPALFDRRYSTRRIIRNLVNADEEEAEMADMNAEPEYQDETGRPMSELDFSLRRASMRQSIALGDLPLADFLWLANVRFADEQLVAPIAPPAPLANAAAAPSLCSVEIAALESEMAMLQATADRLRSEIAQEEENFDGAHNVLFAAVQTSEQNVLENVQADLGQLKRLCLLQAESEALQEGLVVAASARSSFRQMGERALADTRVVYALAGALHHDRERLRGAKMAALERLTSLRRQRQQREQRQAENASRIKVLSAVFGALSHCRVIALDEKANTAQIDLCDAVRLVVNASHVEVTALEPLASGWRLSVLKAAGVLGTTIRASGSSLFDVVRTIFFPSLSFISRSFAFA